MVRKLIPVLSLIGLVVASVAYPRAATSQELQPGISVQQGMALLRSALGGQDPREASQEQVEQAVTSILGSGEGASTSVAINVLAAVSASGKSATSAASTVAAGGGAAAAVVNQALSVVAPGGGTGGGGGGTPTFSFPSAAPPPVTPTGSGDGGGATGVTSSGS